LNALQSAADAQGKMAVRDAAALRQQVHHREKEIGGPGGSLEPPGSLLTHLHTAYMAYSECLPTRLNLLAERTCFS
jgi:hypothetical protein